VEVYFWFSFPSVRATFRTTTSVVDLGDIIQLSNFTVKTTVHHTMIVTDKDKNKQVFVTYRNDIGSPAAKNRYIGDISGGQLLQGFAVKSNF
jgi:hypothetical protein